MEPLAITSILTCKREAVSLPASLVKGRLLTRSDDWIIIGYHVARRSTRVQMSENTFQGVMRFSRFWEQPLQPLTRFYRSSPKGEPRYKIRDKLSISLTQMPVAESWSTLGIILTNTSALEAGRLLLTSCSRLFFRDAEFDRPQQISEPGVVCVS